MPVAEISWRRPNSRDLAGFRATARSLQLINLNFDTRYGAFVSGPKIPFPGTEIADRRDSVRMVVEITCRSLAWAVIFGLHRFGPLREPIDDPLLAARFTSFDKSIADCRPSI